MIIYLRKRKKLLKIKTLNRKALITFSGGGQLGFYYQGICAYLRDNFDLTDVRFAGISIGLCTLILNIWMSTPII